MKQEELHVAPKLFENSRIATDIARKHLILEHGAVQGSEMARSMPASKLISLGEMLMEKSPSILSKLSGGWFLHIIQLGT